MVECHKQRTLIETLTKLLAYFTHDRSHLDNKLYRAGEFTDELRRFDKLATMLDDVNPHMKQLVFASIVKSSGQVKTADTQKDVEVRIDVLQSKKDPGDATT